MTRHDPKEFAYCRLPEWHGAGYDGRGIKIAIFESDGPPRTSHGHNVGVVAQAIAPGATVIHRPMPLRDGSQESIQALQAWGQGLIDEGVHICVMSLGGNDRDYIVAAHQRLIDAGMILVTSAGNESDRGLSPASKSDLWISVGAATLNNSSQVVRQSYSSIGEQLDVMAFTAGRTGTSFAAPWAAGMLACWMQAVYESSGRYPNQREALDWIEITSDDMDIEGHDPYTGHGILRLPWPIPTFDFSYKEDTMGLTTILSLIPAGSPNRPGTLLNPQHVTIHNTANPNVSARNHSIYVKGPEAIQRKVSWHYTVDDKEIYQHLPETEVGWHSGTQGNSMSIAIEICEFTDPVKQRNANTLAAKKVAEILSRRGWGTDRLRQHYTWTGKDCPRVLRSTPDGWDKFVMEVRFEMGEGFVPGAFPDVDVRKWYAEDFAKAKALGIIKGDDKGNANPEKPATRAEVLAMILRATGK